MKSTDIKEILKGNFTDDNDRIYWENKLIEIERKENNSLENKKYFEKMSIYDR